jgi:hypothetical protein
MSETRQCLLLLEELDKWLDGADLHVRRPASTRRLVTSCHEADLR